MLKKIEYVPNVYIVYSDSSEEIGRAFIRFSEYYESIKFRGNKHITVKMIEDWWRTTEAGKESSYYDYWEGYNIFGNILLEFWNTESLHPITKYEQEVFELFADVNDKSMRTANIIAFPTTNNVVIDHEVAHVWFDIDPAYKSSQLYNISRLDKKIYEGLKKSLNEMGYNSTVVLDEIQAYMSTYVDTLNDSFPELEHLDLLAHSVPFVTTFKQFEPYRPIPKIEDLI